MKRLPHVSIVSSLVVLSVIIPQVAFAAWWNPTDWLNGWSFFHTTNTRTQVIESRIKELEKKLTNATTSTPEVARKVVVPQKTKIVDTPILKPSTPAPIPVTNTSTALSTYAQCLNDATTLIKQRQMENKLKEQQCLSDNAGNWQAPILCSYSVDTNLIYSACTGNYDVYHASKNNQSSIPSQTQSGFNAVESTIEKQNQETFQRDTCSQLGGSYVGGKCSY